DNGGALDKCSLRAAEARPPKVPRGKMWPLNSSNADWFTREPISSNLSKLSGPLWIAKADALPDDWRPNLSQIIWASGWQTWKRLGRRGLWLNGCAESLGEQEDPEIETLAGGKIDWVKLTHESGYANGSMPNVATYRLVASNIDPDLDGRSYFFWKS